jgi:hypothetical protein
VHELFTLLKINLFFKDNSRLKLSYQAETIDQLLGLSYHAIHACYSSCIFKFERGLSKAKACSYLKGPTLFLASCYTIFPWSHDWSIYIRCSSLAKLNVIWHNTDKINDGSICSLWFEGMEAYWQHLAWFCSWFPQHKVGLALNIGVNLYVDLSTIIILGQFSFSTTTCHLEWQQKSFFVMLTLLMLGKRVCDKWEDRCLFVATNGGVGETMERG